MKNVEKWIPFESDCTAIPLPEKFTFPFYYEPHSLALKAVSQVQNFLKNQTHIAHNFGLKEGQSGLVIGKMFGVLVVKNAENELGFLAAFSGKLAESNHHEYFVPPVFDLLEENGYFKEEEAIINSLNRELETLEKSDELEKLIRAHFDLNEAFQQQKKTLKETFKQTKKERDTKRKKAASTLHGEALEVVLEQLRSESINEHFYVKHLQNDFREKSQTLQQQIDVIQAQIDYLKEKRKELSNALQDKIFDSYYFLDAHSNKQSLLSIFSNYTQTKPPAGAGECAAPKLLQYAYLHQLKPICMAEFWWGASPKSEIRVHQQIYPSCRGKCEPILSHMLRGLVVDDNPLTQYDKPQGDLEILWEDEYILAINKPANFLSVPGKTILDCVYARVKERYPNASGPLIVHRLDMSTSGILILAKDKQTHEKLQKQFTKRVVKKRYVALLEGVIESDKGRIDLPLRVDLDDRPRQLVCYEYGKKAVTEYEVKQRSNTHTLIHFYPITGRTHQLRVHAAHPLGLNMPIVGDDIYGNKAKRLYLHAEHLTFIHPVSRETISIHCPCEFPVDNFGK